MPVDRLLIPILDSREVETGMYHFYNDAHDLEVVNSVNIIWIRRELDDHNPRVDQFSSIPKVFPNKRLAQGYIEQFDGEGQILAKSRFGHHVLLKSGRRAGAKAKYAD